MNLKLYLPAALLFSYAFQSCTKKDNIVKAVPVSSLTVVNAMVNTDAIITDMTEADSVKAYLSTGQRIGFGSFYEFSVPSGSVPTVAYQVSDTNTYIYKNDLSLKPQTIYTLYLAGISNGKNMADTLLSEDHPPYHPNTDSTVGIRFVNLSPDSNPLSINIQDSINVEINSLPYKGISGFKNYSAKAEVTQYTFEIRDAVSGDVLTTYTYYLSPFQNITIALVGLADMSSSQPMYAIQINNF